MTTLEENHSAGFRPSSFPALSECDLFQGRVEETQYSTAGTEFHEEIAALLKKIEILYRGTFEGVRTLPEIPSHLTWSWKLVKGYIESGWKIIGVEQEFVLFGEYGEELTKGTVDLLLCKDWEILIIDWKTGQMHKFYEWQIAGYMMAVRDAYPKYTVKGLIAYPNDEETRGITLSYQQCCDMVLSLWEHWQVQDFIEGKAHINQHCGFCANKPRCPAWLEQAAPAIQLVQTSPMPIIDIDALRNDPAALGRFMTAYSTLEDLIGEWKLKSVLKDHLETGKEVPGWRLINNSGNTRQVPDIEEAAKRFAEMGYTMPMKEKTIAAYSYAKKVNPKKKDEKTVPNLTTSPKPSKRRKS